ncbi:MAG TPA: LysR family transcriptional regulator [Syntrophobacteraceae bacterium]|nr:LysR family transcriptional regulator [Syntrophobacteraceae bacterium]
MEIRQLKSFQAVANLLSFNKAAGRLHYAQSSISAQIQALEEEFGVQLFSRLGRKVQLTECGIQLLQYANKILELVDETRSKVMENEEPVGSLTVRIPETFGVHCLPGVIKEFHNRFPRVQLNFITCAHEGLENDLRKGITDLAFLLAESISAADLDVEILGFHSVVLVASPHHPLASRKSVHTKDLGGETILLSKVDCSYRKVFEQVLEQEEAGRFSKIEFYSVEVIKKCLVSGVGITVLPEVAVRDEVAQGKLVVLPWSEGKIDVALLMIWYRDRWISPTLRAFMEVTKKIAAQAY